MAGGFPVTSSMFACLKLEDEIREEKSAAKRNRINEQIQNAETNKKKGNSKKNKNQKTDDESKQLQKLAFGRPASGGKKKGGKNVNTNHSKKDEPGWESWKHHDREVVEDQYKQDLEKALLESRLQMEKKDTEIKDKQERLDAGVEIPTTREEKKKKKQKSKAKPMSLEDFKQLPPTVRKTSTSEDSDGEPIPPPPQRRVPSTEQDPKFFNNVHDQAEQILKQDKMQDDYRKTYAADNAVVAKLKHDIELKDQKIAELISQMEKLQAETKQVKHRNKQLCVILAQGEMKDKAQVLLQVDDLNSVKDELTEQVSSLTVELEKEKSKNRALKTESDKLKGNKHGK